MGRTQPRVGAGTMEFWASGTCSRSTSGNKASDSPAALSCVCGLTLPVTVNGLNTLKLVCLVRARELVC
jgi:hypothetical protein